MAARTRNTWRISTCTPSKISRVRSASRLDRLSVRVSGTSSTECKAQPKAALACRYVVGQDFTGGGVIDYLLLNGNYACIGRHNLFRRDGEVRLEVFVADRSTGPYRDGGFHLRRARNDQAGCAAGSGSDPIADGRDVAGRAGRYLVADHIEHHLEELVGPLLSEAREKQVKPTELTSISSLGLVPGTFCP